MNTFLKQERLCGKQQIDILFEHGKKFKNSSFLVIWQEIKDELLYPVTALVSIPKRKISKATQRNRLKRLIKECYRKEKKLLYDFLSIKGKKIKLALIYQKSSSISYKELDSEIKLIINRLKNKL